MILAAGLGRRLQPLTLFRAKPAIPFLNRPLISYPLDLLRRVRVEEIVINLHHLPQSILDSVGFQGDDEGSPRLNFSHEKAILGTAGAIGKVRDFFSRDTLIVCNGKIYFEEDLSAALRFHQDSGAAATLVLVPFRPCDPFHPVFLDGEQNITRFGSAQDRNDSGDGYVFTGVHILSRDALPFIPQGPSDTVRDLYPTLMRRGYPVRGFVSRAFWCECSLPGLYLEKSLQVLRRQGKKNLVESESLQARCRSVIAGRFVEAPESCVLENCVIWDHARVGRDSSLRNVILSTGVELAPDTHLQNAVVTPLPETISADARQWVQQKHLIRPL